jgi:hypothetical protein
MSLSTKTTDSLVQDPTIFQVAGRNGYSTTDHGRLENLQNSFELGVRSNLTGQLSRWLNYKGKGLLEEPMSREDFEATGAESLGIEYRKQTASQVDYQIGTRLRDRQLQDQATGSNRWLTEFTGTLSGGLADPLAFGLPVAKLDKLRLLVASNKVAPAAAGTLAASQTFKSLLAVNTLAEAPYGAMRLDMQDHYGVDYAGMSLALNPVFSGVFAGFRGYGMYNRALNTKRMYAKNDAYIKTMEGAADAYNAGRVTVGTDAQGRPTITSIDGKPIKDYLDSAYDAANAQVKKLIDENPRLKEIAQGKVKEKDLTFDDIRDVNAVLHLQQVQAQLSVVARKLADDYLAEIAQGNRKIRKSFTEYNRRVNRISEAIMTGDISKLKDADIEWLKANANIFIRRASDSRQPRTGPDGFVLEEGFGLHTEGSQAQSYNMAVHSRAPKNVYSLHTEAHGNGNLIISRWREINVKVDNDPFAGFDGPSANFYFPDGKVSNNFIDENYGDDIKDKNFDDLFTEDGEINLHPVLNDIITASAIQKGVNVDDPFAFFPYVAKALQDKKQVKVWNKEFKKAVETENAKLKADYAALRKADDSIFANQEEITELARDAINDIFLGGESALPKPKHEISASIEDHVRFTLSPQSFLGKVDFDDFGNMTLADAQVYAELFNIKGPASHRAAKFYVMSHEYIHQLSYFAPDEYKQLIDLIRSDKSIYATIAEYTKAKGYGVLTQDMEMASHFLEFAMTRQEFWDALKKSDIELYNSFAEYSQRMVNDLAGYLGFVDFGAKFLKKLDDPKAVDLAAKFGSILADIREKYTTVNMFEGMYNKALADARVQRVTDDFEASIPYQREAFGDGPFDAYEMLKDTKGDISQYLAKIPSYENPIFKDRIKTQDRYNSDSSKFLLDNLNQMLGDEELVNTLLTVPKGVVKTQARREHINNVAEILGAAGYPDLARKYETILTNLQAGKSRLRAILKLVGSSQIDLSEKAKILSELRELGLAEETMYRVAYIMADPTAPKSVKMGKIAQYFAEEDLSMLTRFVHDDLAKASIKNLARSTGKKKTTQLDQIKTLLDGTLRKDVTRGVSITKKVEMVVQQNQIPLIEYLSEKGLKEVYFGEDATSYMSSYFGRKQTNTEEEKRFGADLTEASLELHKNLMVALSTGVIPPKFKGIPDFEGLVDVVRDINRAILGDINKLGVNIRENKNFTGYSVRYDQIVVRDMGIKDFVDYMTQVLDHAETKRLHGGVMTNNQGEIVPFNLFKFLQNMYRSIDEGTYYDDGATANKSIVGALRKSAKLAFKPEYKVDALIKFSNFKNLGRLYMDQVRSRAEKVALVNALGHDPYGNLQEIVRELALTRTKGIRTFDMTAKQVTGMLDTPVDEAFARIMQKPRQLQNIAYLGGAAFSALSDIPLAMTTFQYLGVDFSYSEFVKSYKNAIDMQFRGKNKEMTAFFQAQAAGIDILTRTIAARTLTGEQLDDGRLGKANSGFFELFGINRITSTHQVMTIDIISQWLAQELPKDAPDSTLVQRMLEFGFTPKDLIDLREGIDKAPDGVLRLAPSWITKAKLQEKIQGFYLQYMKEAVLEPDAGAQALTRLGLEAGTFWGEAARIAFQYSSFPLGMGRVVHRRFMYGYQGKDGFNIERMSHLMAFLGTAIAFAWLTTFFKDLAKGKEPMNPFDMNQLEFNRLISQSGILGIGDLGFNAVRFQDPLAFFSPVIGEVASLLSGDTEGVKKIVTGENYPIIGPIMQQIIGGVAGETIQSIRRDMESYITSLNDKELDNLILANERGGYLKIVKTPDGERILATTKQAAMIVAEKKKRMALDTD